MKWTYYALPDDDPRAKKRIVDEISVGASEHTLAKKLLPRVSEESGGTLLIAFDNLDADADWLYEYGTYGGGKRWFDAAGTQQLPQMDCPIGGLILFVGNYLRTSEEAVVLCQNYCSLRARAAPRESRVVSYGEETYHLLTRTDANVESIECAIRESSSHWVTGVCSQFAEVPESFIESEAFFDAIVAETKHVFTSALDGEGYLIWSPKTSTSDLQDPGTWVKGAGKALKGLWGERTLRSEHR